MRWRLANPGTCLSGPFAWQDASLSTDAFEGLRPHHDLPDVRVLVASPQLAKRAAGRVCRGERADGAPGGLLRRLAPGRGA